MSENARIYRADEACIFKKNNDEFGGLSNMATKFPIRVLDIPIRTTEALYQACRFPHHPDIQEKIIGEPSPMTVKMISRANRNQSRADWDLVKVKIMKWCIQLKLAQNFLTFSELLHSTGTKSIVESSSKDDFWGAIPNSDFSLYTGKNALGRLLMELRQRLNSSYYVDLLCVPRLEINNFNLLGQEIGGIDERINFVQSLMKYWSSSSNPLPVNNGWVKDCITSKNISNLGYKFSEFQQGLPF